MTSSSETDFKQNYHTHLKHLKLKGFQAKTIEAYSRAMRRVGAYFDYQINDLSESQLQPNPGDLSERAFAQPAQRVDRTKTVPYHAKSGTVGAMRRLRKVRRKRCRPEC